MTPPGLDTAIIAAMQADPKATQRTVRKAVGGTEYYFSEAVKRLRDAGRIQQNRFKLAKPKTTISEFAPATLADTVRAEVDHLADRRATARKTTTGMTPLEVESLADRFRRLAHELDDEEAEALADMEAQERRNRELERLPSPSAVLRRAKRDWPGQCRDVQALATELGVSLGEAWRRVISAGVDCMRESGDGEAVGNV